MPEAAEIKTRLSAEFVDRIAGGLVMREAPLTDVVNQKARTATAVVATESVTLAYDWGTDQYVDDIMLVDGATWDDPGSLLESHSRWWTGDILGSIRNIRREGDGEQSVLLADLVFADDDGAASRAWKLVEQRHIRNVSLGATIGARVIIESGESQEINGRIFTAGERPLRVITNWHLRETSLVVFGADKLAKIKRSMLPETSVGLGPSEGQAAQKRRHNAMTVTTKQRSALRKLGLPKGADAETVRAFFDDLEEEERAEILALAESDDKAGTAQETKRTKDQGAEPNGGTAQDSETMCAELLAQERARIDRIEELAGDDVPRDIVRKVIKEGWPIERVAPEFLAATRAARNQTGTPVHGGIRAYNHDAQCTERTVGVGLAMRCGLDPMAIHLRNEAGANTRPRTDREIEARAQLVDVSQRYRDMSLFDICREALRIARVAEPHSREELVQRAMSTAALSNIFTTSVNAQLLMSFDEAPDTTQGWTHEEDVADFKTNDRITAGRFGELDLLPENGEANHATMDDSKESYKIYRYAKQFVFDERAMINDSLDVLMTTPAQLGDSAAALRPNLVYAALLANANLSDGGALFNATAITTTGGHANLTTAALSIAALQAAAVDMSQIYEKTAEGQKKRLNIRPRYLIVPGDLEFTAREILTSAELRDTTASKKAGIRNVITDLNIQLRVDGRIDAVGVWDNFAKTQRTGSAANWFLATEGSTRRTITVGYLAGTGRRPTVRPYVLNQGRWGLGWDIKHDIGVKPIDYRGMHKSTGAG